MGRRIRFVSGVLIVATIAAISVLLAITMGTRTPQADSGAAPGIAPLSPGATAAQKRVDLPEWTSDLLAGEPLSWCDLQARIARFSEDEIRNWNGWLPSAMEEARSSEEWFARIVMIAGILRLKNESVVQVIQALNSSGDRRLRVASLVSLALIQPDKAQGLLSPLFSDPNPSKVITGMHWNGYHFFGLGGKSGDRSLESGGGERLMAHALLK